MTDQYVGEIRMFGFSFAPAGWAQCNGQILPINQNQALFSLLGTTYGGNGVTTFALPDLQGRAPVDAGTATTGTTYFIGQEGGSEGVALTTAQIPPHTHGWRVCSAPGTADLEKGGDPNEPIATGYTAFNAGPATSALAAGSTSQAGGGVPHQNMAPYLVINFCIALQGIFPPRP